MKTIVIVVIGIVAFFVFLVIMGAVALLFTNQQNTNTITSQPTATPQPRNIAISYSCQIVQSITTQYGFDTMPDSGKVFVEVNMTIRNNGYSDSFNTNPYNFNLVADNIKYSYDDVTYSVGKWDSVDILNGGTFNGVLVFQVPHSAASFTLGYEAFFTDFNIIWTKT